MKTSLHLTCNPEYSGNYRNNAQVIMIIIFSQFKNKSIFHYVIRKGQNIKTQSKEIFKMTAEEIYNKYGSHTEKWLAALDEYSDDSFMKKPSADEWSVSQVYFHLAEVTDKCLANAIMCAENKGETGHSGWGPKIFSLMGSFPPVKLIIKKIPPGLDRIYLPEQIEKAEARRLLGEALQKMKSNISKIDGASKDQRIAHWAAGWFNALQWYQSAEMHLKHHFRQKKRIDNFLRK